MSYITLKCKNCGSGMSINPDSKSCTCTHCGSTFLMMELLDEQDIHISKAMSQKEFESKIDFAEALKKGETYLYQAEYQQAEESFKRAIELNDKSHKGYLGVVKAKTKNLNKIPETPEYREYLKLAIKYVDKDNEMYLKSEIAKLELLEHEHSQQVLEEKKKAIEIKKQKNHKADTDAFWGKITTTLIVVLTIMIFSAIYLTKSFYKGNNRKPVTATYEISTASQLAEYALNDDFMNATIIIKNDIDFKDASLTPIGTTSKPFSGVFYGNGHTLSNFEIKSETRNGNHLIGFFGFAKNAQIYGMKLDNVSITGTSSESSQVTHRIGFVCGMAENSTIKTCEVLNTCSLNVNHQMNCTLSFGGIVGEAKNTSLTYSYSNATASATYSVITSQYSAPLKFYSGGVVGNANETTITNCYSTSKISLDVQSSEEIKIISYTGGIVAYNLSTNAKINNCYFGGSIYNKTNAEDTGSFVGGIVGYGANFAKMNGNIALYTQPSNYQKGDNIIMSNLTVMQLFDHTSANAALKYYSTEGIPLKIAEIFSSEIWELENPTAPNLK